jgi:hypothetical protein
MEPIPRAVGATRPAGRASGLARMVEARGLTLGRLRTAVLAELDQGQ